MGNVVTYLPTEYHQKLIAEAVKKGTTEGKLGSQILMEHFNKKKR